MTTQREVMQRALNALEYHTQQTRPIHNSELAIDDLRAALAEPQGEPERMGLDAIRQAIEERDDMEQKYHDLAKDMVYHGNSVSWWHSKAIAYRNAIDEVWAALRTAGIQSDGTKTCADGVRELAEPQIVPGAESIDGMPFVGVPKPEPVPLTDEQLLDVYWQASWNADGKSPMRPWEADYAHVVIRGLHAVLATAVPSGYVVVPVEPTPEIVNAAFIGKIEPQDFHSHKRSRELMADNYRAMIAAAQEKAK